MTFLLRRLRACLDDRAHPYERKVCLWAFNIRLVFILVPALTWWATTAWLPGWCAALAGDAGTIAWEQQLGADWAGPLTLLGWAWRLYGAWGAGWLGAFVWADLRLEEWWRELWVGCSHNPNVFPTCTLEGYGGFKRGGYDTDDANARLYDRTKFIAQLMWERTGQPRYDIIPPEDVTWAIRAHRRWVRPRLVRRGVPGYEPGA